MTFLVFFGCTSCQSYPIHCSLYFAGLASRHGRMLDVNTLAGMVQELYQRGLAQSSTWAYDTGKRQFLQFCQAAGLTPLPVSENTLCLFVAYLSQRKLQHSTIRSYLSAVCHLQISAALPDPATSSFPRLSYVLKGLHRITKPSSRHQLPITPAILDLLYKSWSQSPVSYDARLLWAACNVGFFGFFRAGEFTSRSLSFPDEGIIAVTDVTRDPNYPHPLFVFVYPGLRLIHSALVWMFTWDELAIPYALLLHSWFSWRYGQQTQRAHFFVFVMVLPSAGTN